MPDRNFHILKFVPKVEAQKPLVGAPLHTIAKLKCDVEAFPNSNNYWMRDRDEVLIDGGKFSIQERRSGYKVVMVLTIQNVSKTDIGTYTCVASNTKGKNDDSVRIYELDSMQDNSIEDKPLEDESNWFYPSVAPAPLELETMSKANNLKINQNTSFCVFVTIVLCVFMIAR